MTACIAELRRRSDQMMRAHIAKIPDGIYSGEAFVDSDGVDPDALAIRLRLRKEGTDLYFDFSESSPPCRGPLNSVIATTKAAVYLAIKHVFPDVPINAGCFEPLHIADPHGTFLYARYPRPVSGCAAEVSSRIAESVFTTLAQAIPDDLFAAPAGTSGNLTLGGYDPLKERHYIMYVFSGGGYGGSADGDGLTNGCSTIGISKTQPTEVLEQHYPILFERYALRERSGGAGKTRGGFGVDYKIRVRRGEALLSYLMDHGRFGPPGLFGGKDGAPNSVIVSRQGGEYTSPHWSKDEDIRLVTGDVITVGTPGGGGYGDPWRRDPAPRGARRRARVLHRRGREGGLRRGADRRGPAGRRRARHRRAAPARARVNHLRAYPRPRPSVGGVALESGGEAGHDHRLAQVVIHARREALLAVAIHRVGRQRDDRDPGSSCLALADRARGRVAIELGHLAIEEDDVVGQAAG